MPTAVVIDGAYFLRRFKHRYPNLDGASPRDVALGVMWLAAEHVAIRCGGIRPSLDHDDQGTPFFSTIWTETADLYRIFFYDCPPLSKKTQYPISKRALDLSQTQTATSRLAIHAELLRTRKVALRLGRLNDGFDWRPRPDAVKKWLVGTFAPADDDFEINTVQKGVDMRLGLDVAAMAFKKQVDQIILVAADGDFVPAVKLARREGIDVVLDAMGGVAARDLIDNVDGIRDVSQQERR